jgi:hypothetical protein
MRDAKLASLGETVAVEDDAAVNPIFILATDNRRAARLSPWLPRSQNSIVKSVAPMSVGRLPGVASVRES